VFSDFPLISNSSSKNRKEKERKRKEEKRKANKIDVVTTTYHKDK